MPDQGVSVGELAPAEQTGHLLPVGQLLFLTLKSLHQLLFVVTVTTVGSNQTPLGTRGWVMDTCRRKESRLRIWVSHVSFQACEDPHRPGPHSDSGLHLIRLSATIRSASAGPASLLGPGKAPGWLFSNCSTRMKNPNRTDQSNGPPRPVPIN